MDRAEVPRTAAVVLHWRREAETVRAVESLLDSDYPLTVVLVDNGSNDGSGERLRVRFPDVQHLALPNNLGFTGGCNRGIERARELGADYVLLLNDDAVVDTRTVTHLVDVACGEERVGAVAPKILHRDRPDLIWYGGGRVSRIRALGIHIGEDERDEIDDPDDPLGVSFVTGCCVLLSLPALDRVGAFPEDFFAYMEDVDLSLRLMEGGYRLLYVPWARAYHRSPPPRGDETPFQIVHRDRNRRRLARRRFSLAERILFASFFYPTRIMHFARYLSRGDLARARAVIRGVTGV